MSLSINLLKLELDPLTRITVYRRPYEDNAQLDEIREQLDIGQFAMRLGDRIWGCLLPEQVVEQYEFDQFSHLAIALDPKFMNSLLRYTIRQRLEQLGLRRVGYDQYETPGEIAFALGAQAELIAKPRWLVRPFSLPEDTTNVFSLLINPRLTYRFRVNLAQLSEVGFHWAAFGDKVRALTAEQTSTGETSLEEAHTALVIEERELGRLLCQWRDGEQQEVSLGWCWPLANTQNRYRYLKSRYSGYTGDQFARDMKKKDDAFFALKNVLPLIESFGKQIESLELGSDLKMKVESPLELTKVNHQVADELQASLLLGEIGDIGHEESVADEREDEEDYGQLELF